MIDIIQDTVMKVYDLKFEQKDSPIVEGSGLLD